MKKSHSLLIIADSHSAKIFNKIGDKTFDLELISTLVADLDEVHKQPQRVQDSMGSSRHAIEPRTDRREVERHGFAQKISDNLFELHKTNNDADGLIIIASHKLLQEIEDVLPNNLKSKITFKLAKDLMQFSDIELKEHLIKYFNA